MNGALGLQADRSWFYEGTVPGRRSGNISHGFRITELVCYQQTQFQEVLIFDNPVYGRVFVLDGIVQLSAHDEKRYHELLVHPAMLGHASPQRVLIVGGGDGGALRECLRHDPVEVVMIDLDGELVSLCREHLPMLSDGGFDDPRLTLLHEDAALAVQRYHQHFDVAIIDGSDAIGPPMPLFGEPFYKDVARALKPDGICAVQGGSMLDLDFLVTVRQRIAAHLPQVAPLRLTMPSYHCGEYCFLLAAGTAVSLEPDLPQLAVRVQQRGLADQLEWYSPELHRASVCQPRAFELV